MRPLACFVLIAALAAGLRDSTAEVEKESLEFSENLSCVALTETAARAREKGDWARAKAAFQAACRKASSRDLEGLAEYVRGIDVTYLEFERDYLELADAALRLRIPKHVPPQPGLARAVIPDALAQYPEALREAAAYYLNLGEPYAALKASVSPARYFYRNRPQFLPALTGAVTGTPASSVEEIFSFYEVLCGCGREKSLIEKSQAAAVLLVLARQERWGEAAGAAFFLRGSSVGADSFLSLAKVDVEKALRGALTLEQASATLSLRRLTRLMNEYLQCQGDARVDTLIALAKAAPPELLTLYIRALEKFLTKNPEPKRPEGAEVFHGIWGGGVSGDDSLSTEPIPEVGAEASRRALLYLCGLASPKLPNKAARALARAFDQRYLEESYPALRKLLDHPAGGVVNAAGQTLADAEQKADAPTIPTTIGYRLLVDGQPLKNAKLDLISGEDETGWRFPTMTDEEGRLSVGRDPFVDPREPIRECLVLNLSHAKPDGLIFCRPLTLPEDETKVHDIEISTHRLRIRLEIPRFAAELEGQNMKVALSDVLAKRASQSKLASYRFGAPVGKDFEFSQLADGTYDLEISVPGCVRWTGQVRVDANQEFRVALQKGSDVRYRLLSSDERAGFIEPKLLEGGQEVKLADFQNDGIVRGVPPGEYVLRVPSSAEVRKTQEHLLGDDTHFGSVDIPFVVLADSPALIDLGAISLPALSAGER